MNKSSFYHVNLVLAFLIPFAGATGYIHNNFAASKTVEKIEQSVLINKYKVDKIYALMCKMAINQKLQDAVEICTKK